MALHHVEPLGASCAHLAQLIVPGGLLVIDELDVSRIDERAAAWWLARRRALGFAEEGRLPATGARLIAARAGSAAGPAAR